MTEEDVNTFEKLNAQLESLHAEMTLLSKKSPNDAVNAFKLRFVNTTLKQCNAFLGKEYIPFNDFTEFLSDDVPSNSDVTLMISQYIECLEKFRTDHIKHVGSWWWVIDGEDKGRIRTAMPKKLTK